MRQPAPDPTSAEIRQRCEEIQRIWSDAERRRRTVQESSAILPQPVSWADVDWSPADEAA